VLQTVEAVNLEVAVSCADVTIDPDTGDVTVGPPVVYANITDQRVGGLDITIPPKPSGPSVAAAGSSGTATSSTTAALGQSTNQTDSKSTSSTSLMNSNLKQ
jgi:hypothetical protein